MTRALLGLAAIAIVGCGDDGKQCGPGTVDSDGLCVPAMPVVCGDGTRLEDDHCVIDPAACQAGTVLIANRCLDPTSGLVIDLEEGPEPNALGVAAGVEASTAPAGTITLRTTAAFVVHGHIAPFRDADGDGQLDADFDTYRLDVAGPTLLDVSVDGVGGTQGAFYVAGDPMGALPAYERYGLNLTGDTSRRRMFLPVAGRFALAIADTRTLAIGRNPPPPAGSGAAAGGPGAEYYVSITVASPAPTTIPVTGTQGALAPDEVAFFTAALPAGTHDLANAMPGAAAASLAVLRGGHLEGYADETAGVAAVEISLGAGDAPLIAVDATYNYGPAPEPFTLTITPR